MLSVDCRFQKNRPCHQVRLPNLPPFIMPLGASDSSRRNAMKTEAVVEKFNRNGIVRKLYDSQPQRKTLRARFALDQCHA